MSDEIIKVLEALCNKLGLAIDWTAANALPYIEELIKKYITFEIATSVFVIVVWLVLAVGGVLLFRFLFLKAQKDDDWVPWAFACGIFTAIFVIVFFATACSKSMEIITCLTLPEKQIFDYLMRLT